MSSSGSTCWFITEDVTEEAKEGVKEEAKEGVKRTRWDAILRPTTCWCKDVCLLKILKLRNSWFEKQLEKVRKLKGKAFKEGMADIHAMKANTYDGDNEDLIELLELNAKNHRRRSI